MHQLTQISLVVNDYDEALNFYVNKLGFILIEDKVMSAEKRWVVISPNSVGGCKILLAKAANNQQQASVGNQTGGRVFLFLETDDFEKDHANLLKHNINIIRGPFNEAYGRVLVFADLYGNLWDLIEPLKN